MVKERLYDGSAAQTQPRSRVGRHPTSRYANQWILAQVCTLRVLKYFHAPATGPQPVWTSHVETELWGKYMSVRLGYVFFSPPDCSVFLFHVFLLQHFQMCKQLVSYANSSNQTKSTKFLFEKKQLQYLFNLSQIGAKIPWAFLPVCSPEVYGTISANDDLFVKDTIFRWVISLLATKFGRGVFGSWGKTITCGIWLSVWVY